MSKLKEFFTGLPKACWVPEGIAQIAGRFNGDLFDWERINPNSVLQRYPSQTSLQRFEPAFKAWEHLGNPEIVEYAKRLSVLADLASQYNSKGLGSKIIIDAEAATLKVLEPGFPTVSALLTVDEAVVLSSWA